MLSASKFLETMTRAERQYQEGIITRSQRNTVIALYLALDGDKVKSEFEMTQAVNYASA